ncbi:hypothetical protein LZ30DRAFT_42698 [Colletotrichum cereale]|nr:hypothetical protein LZ30DRAFT_42698 [Colletotrichum cereale]
MRTPSLASPNPAKPWNAGMDIGARNAGGRDSFAHAQQLFAALLHHIPLSLYRCISAPSVFASPNLASHSAVRGPSKIADTLVDDAVLPPSAFPSFLPSSTDAPNTQPSLIPCPLLDLLSRWKGANPSVSNRKQDPRVVGSWPLEAGWVNQILEPNVRRPRVPFVRLPCLGLPTLARPLVRPRCRANEISAGQDGRGRTRLGLALLCLGCLGSFRYLGPHLAEYG